MKIQRFLIIILIFILSFCLCACAKEKNDVVDNQSKIEILNKNSSRFLVTVVDDNGDAVQGVILQIRKDHKVTACTNKDGVATFPIIPSSGYRLYVVQCPEGYEYTEGTYIHLKQGAKEYTLNITKK